MSFIFKQISESSSIEAPALIAKAIIPPAEDPTIDRIIALGYSSVIAL